MAALAKALPPTLEELYLSGTDCGDDGLVALAAALPALTRLVTLWCSDNPAATARGWVALAAALPSLPALQELWIHGSPGMGPEGAAALAAAVPSCQRLLYLEVSECGLDERAKSTLKALERPNGHPQGELELDV